MFTASDESFIILQDTLLTGITNLSFSYSANQESNILLSNGGINRKVNSPQIINCSISKDYFGRDFLKELTGHVGLSGQFVYGTNALDFTDAAISSYTISANTSANPQISVNIKIYGDLKPTTTLRTATASVDNEKRDLRIDSMSFDFLGKNSAIDNFSFSANFDCQPTYEIESIKSSTIKVLPPVSYSVSADIEMTEQEYEDVTGLLESENYDRSFSLSFTDQKAIEDIQAEESRYLSYTGSGLDTGVYNLSFDTGIAELDTFSFSKLGLNSQNVSISPRDTIKLNVSYDGYDLSLPTGNPVSSTSFGGIQSQIDQIKTNVDTSIDDFIENFLNLTKLTGEDFESIPTGTGFSNSGYLFNVGAYIGNEVDFESTATGTTTGDLYKLGADEETSVVIIDEIDFESTPTGTTDQNLTQLT